jgi:hypothetical protein
MMMIDGSEASFGHANGSAPKNRHRWAILASQARMKGVRASGG